MISLPFGSKNITPSAKRVKRRAKEVGSGIPDILVPSAYREVEPSEDLRRAAKEMADVFREGREHQDTESGNGDGLSARVEAQAGTVEPAQAVEIAREADRQLLELKI
jgi:hypothetical protein